MPNFNYNKLRHKNSLYVFTDFKALNTRADVNLLLSFSLYSLKVPYGKTENTYSISNFRVVKPKKFFSTEIAFD